ncbi:hypothetical protein PA3_06980 [Acinetobacter pittii]|uniref:Uncharacterized protein n=1 Tax=Acinetobacter pittii TaxID=48296 RepID=A0A4Y3J720_ACIPI|nr:hypothetical protein PA3_06980 [Acinetobacter pittii]
MLKVVETGHPNPSHGFTVGSDRLERVVEIVDDIEVVPIRSMVKLVTPGESVLR